MAILEKEVLTTLAGNVKYYENNGYNIKKERDKWGKLRIPRGSKILVKIEDLPKGSQIKLTKICDICGEKCNKKQSYESILRLREKSDGKDRCIKCGNIYAQKLRKENIPYNRSLEYFAKENNLEYLLKEFSDKNNIALNKIFKGSADTYLWNCRKCGNEYDAKVVERTSGNNCPYCSGRRVLIGFNDIWTTNPEAAKLLKNPDDGYKYTAGSNIRTDFKCEKCNCIIKNKVINSIVSNGLSCSRCSDGISYPEKFMMSMLEQLSQTYIHEHTFDWSRNIKHNIKKLSGNKRYDFYIPSLNMIIETHGGQHYDNRTQFDRSLKDEQENDRLKENLAKDNGINKYIIIDCRYSQIEWIKNNIILSQLNIIFDLSHINWMKCHEFACNSLVKIVCDLWNSGIKSSYEIARKLKLDRSGVNRFLKQGKLLGWCDYDPKESQRNSGRKSNHKKKIIQLTKDGTYIREWESARDACNSLDICYKKISSVCNGKMLFAGDFKWVFKSEYEEFKMTGNILNKDKRGKSRKVICLNTLEVFDSLTMAGKKVNRAANNIKANILGKSKFCGVLEKTGELLHWMYKDDYDNYIEEQNKKII